MEIEVEIKNLSVRISGQELLRNITMTVRPEETLVVLGPSGAGKSTLLRAIAGLERPCSGSIQRGEQVWYDQDHYLPPFRREIGMVFQELALWPHLTVREQLQLVARHQRRIHDVDDLLEQVKLSDKEKRFPSELSGGEKQRLALARALVGRPRILLLDEPFSGLDWQIKNDIMQFINWVRKDRKITMILVTHDQFEAERIADRIVIMNQAEVVQIGRMDELLGEPQTEFVSRFLEPVKGRQE